MKKLLMAMTASMLLFGSTAYAKEANKPEMIEMLKDAGVEPSKINLLDYDEMERTKGESWFSNILKVILRLRYYEPPRKIPGLFWV